MVIMALLLCLIKIVKPANAIKYGAGSRVNIFPPVFVICRVVFFDKLQREFSNIHEFVMKGKEQRNAVFSFSTSRSALPGLIEEVCLCILSLHKHPLGDQLLAAYVHTQPRPSHCNTQQSPELQHTTHTSQNRPAFKRDKRLWKSLDKTCATSLCRVLYTSHSIHSVRYVYIMTQYKTFDKYDISTISLFLKIHNDV